jgi:hypothetical protein
VEAPPSGPENAAATADAPPGDLGNGAATVDAPPGGLGNGAATVEAPLGGLGNGAATVKNAVPDRRPVAHVHSSQGGMPVFVSSPALQGVFYPHQDALKGWTTYEEKPPHLQSIAGYPHHNRALFLKYRQPRHPSKITNNPTKPASHEMRF